MKGWWEWTKWALVSLVEAALLLTIYGSVVKTRFESVIFSVVVLMYIDLIYLIGNFVVDFMTAQDLHNDMFLQLSKFLGAPLSSDIAQDADVMAGQAARIRAGHRMHGITEAVLALLVLFNLVRAVFFQ